MRETRLPRKAESTDNGPTRLGTKKNGKDNNKQKAARDMRAAFCLLGIMVLMRPMRLIRQPGKSQI